ncbi:MAG TPA: hypothetical protein P5287_05040 [bacterium]|nr:hypothetical protein [bacterium]
MKTLFKIEMMIVGFLSVVFIVCSVYLFKSFQRETSSRATLEQRLTAENLRAQQLAEEASAAKRELADAVAVKQEIEKERNAAREEARSLLSRLERESSEKELLRKQLDERVDMAPDATAADDEVTLRFERAHGVFAAGARQKYQVQE